jgi:hypothetical protein
MKTLRSLLLALVALSAIFPASAQMPRIEDWAVRGAQQVLTGTSLSTTKVLQSCNGAQITVYNSGTSTKPSLYTDAAGATALANPFSADSNGLFRFYAPAAAYRVETLCAGASLAVAREYNSRTGAAVSVDIRAMGAVCNGIVDDTVAIQAAVNIAGPHNVLWPALTCKTTDTITISQHRVNIVGTGRHSSYLKFEPTIGGKSGFHFTTGTNSVLYEPGIYGMTIISANITLQKFGIRATDTSGLVIRDCLITTGTALSGGFTGGTAISPFTGSGSAGIRLNGREATEILNTKVFADIPLWIDDNPNVSIDVDHLHVADFYAAALGTNPIVYITSGVNLTHVTFDGYQIWALGGRGLYWVDTTSGQSSNHLSISNVRGEQVTGTAPYFQIEHNVAIYEVTFDNIEIQPPAKGWKLRKTVRTSIRNSNYDGTTDVAIDADTTLGTLLLDNFFAQAGSTISMGGLMLVDARAKIASASPTHYFEFWHDPAASNFAAGKAAYFMGEYAFCKQGTLADTATTNIPSLGGTVGGSGVVEVRYTGATKFGAFSAYFDDTQAFLKDTTDASRGVTETCAGNLAGRLCVHWQTAADIVLRNRLGESVVFAFCVRQN